MHPPKENLLHIFRAYDIRGITGKTLFPDIIAKAAAIFANILEEKTRAENVAVSGDGRTSTRALMLAAISGILSAGLDTYMIPPLPLPIFNYAVWSDQNLHGGAYITASHNPPEWNGIRFRWSDGTGFSDENIIIRDRFFENKVKWSEWNQIGHLYERSWEEVTNNYLEFIANLDLEFEKRLRIIIDPMNGIGGSVIPLLFRKQHNIITLNSQVDGFFPSGTADPVDGDISYLQKIVAHSNANLGIAFDGDADRGVVVDEKGRKIPAENLAIIVAEDLLKAGDVVVYNIECSSILRKYLEELGIRAIETRVGDVFVAKYAKKYNAKLGVESSYHFFIPKYGFYYDDAILFTYILTAILSRKKKPLSELADQIGYYYVIRENIPVEDALKWRAMEHLKDIILHEYPDASTIDGIKVYMENASVLIRPSNTEPVIRMMTEAEREEDAIKLHKVFREKLMNAIHKEH